jgi:hypothetical protein
MTWRDTLRPVIAAVLAEHGPVGRTPDEKACTLALRLAWAPYKADLVAPGYAYSIWRDEVNRQLGKKRRADRPRRRIASRTLRKLSAEEKKRWFEKRQLRMF